MPDPNWNRKDADEPSDAPQYPAPDWRVNRATTPSIMWARYGDAIGIENLRAWFGDHWPPDAARPGEDVYVWRDGNRAAPLYSNPDAWLSLMIDQFDPRHIWMSRAVFPHAHGRGLGQAMLRFAEDFARKRGSTRLNICVNGRNTRRLSAVSHDPYWAYAGYRLLGERTEHYYTHELQP